MGCPADLPLSDEPDSNRTLVALTSFSNQELADRSWMVERRTRKDFQEPWMAALAREVDRAAPG